jgi:hypothetical protein
MMRFNCSINNKLLSVCVLVANNHTHYKVLFYFILLTQRFISILKSFNAYNIQKVFFNTINVIMENLYLFIIEKENKIINKMKNIKKNNNINYFILFYTNLKKV